MPWTTPGTATAGDVLTAAFWNTQVRDNANDIDERLRSTKSQSKYRLFTGSNIFSNPTTYTTIPDATDKAALDVSFVKVLGTASQLHVQVQGSINFTSGVAQLMAFGARCVLSGGGTTTLTCSEYYFGTTSRAYFGGAASGTALAAGTYTISPVVRSGGAAALQFTANQDSLSIMVTESLI